MALELLLHHFEPISLSNGPGIRAVVWVQGCTLGCPGCFNPETHAHEGEWVEVEELAAQIVDLGATIEGITISGGEPLQQLPALLDLLRAIKKKTSLSVLVFTGFQWEELKRIKDTEEFLRMIDVLIAGRYEANLRVARGLIGSSNKTAHFLTDRYSIQALDETPEAEVTILPDGQVVLSGIHPVVW